MKSSNFHRVLLAVASVLSISIPVFAQITSNEGDGVLNAPYRGTINSLRECSAGVGYGEVQSHVEPTSSSVSITSPTINIWVEGTWDRSVLRMYEGLDASNSEIDLTGTSEFSPVTVSTDTDDVKRLSFKAIGTKTLAPQTFTIRMSYSLNGSQSNPTRTITVAPITGSFCALPGESEAFLLGTPILDVAVGNARLTVPVGRTAEMIGATFIEKNDNLGPTGIDTNDVLFPGTVETVHIQNNDQFRLGSSQAAKTTWGTPWPGHLIGYQINTDPFGPDGTHFDSQTATSSAFRRIDFIRPMMQSEFDPASVHYIYDDAINNRVVEIRDQATIPNVITLTRTVGDVTRITTSDGRGWNVENDLVDGWITGIIPDSGKGKRSFTYNSAGRVTQVKDASDNLMYEFVYVNDNGGMPTILTEEHRFVDGTLQKVVEHEVISESLRLRKEFPSLSEFRQFDFAYDTANGLNHRLASIVSYEATNGTLLIVAANGTPYTTTFTHDVNNPDGSMVITQVNLPDGTTINHDYDAHIGGQTIDFGFRTKTTRTGPNDGSLVTLDVDYEFFYTQSSSTRLFFNPRIVKQRDGRGAISEVTFDYDNGGEYTDGSDVRGQDLNRLLSITGPTINAGPSGTRTPETRFQYDDRNGGPYLLLRRETDYAAGMHRAVEFDYDELRRLTSQTVDPGGEAIVTRYLLCDTDATQDRITVDADGFWTRARFDNDSRVTITERFLNANAGDLGNACIDPTGPVYTTINNYDINGRLEQQNIENKDQDGVSLTPSTISTSFSYDRLGRLEVQTLDPVGIGQKSNFDYDWMGGIECEFDTSGRGTSRAFDGRGLVAAETPLGLGEVLDANLTTTFQYDAMANLRFTNRPTGAVEERVYDDFDRLKQTKRIPGPGGGNIITTTFEYDSANNLKHTSVGENGTIQSDATALYDEGGFNYETRQRMVADADGADDPITQRKFDWAGNVIEERSLGDTTVADRIITTEYDDAGRVEFLLDSEGGETAFVPDGRGNVTLQTVKINATNSAVTNMVYDALSRAIQITEPEDGVSGRADRVLRYDSRGNMLRERIRDSVDVPKMTTVFAYDNTGQQMRRALLANASGETDAAGAIVTTDRVVDFVYDTDGRLQIQRTYNNNSSTPLETVTTYDNLGRTDRVTDPSGSFTDQDYDDANGRLSRRSVFDGVGTRVFSFGYDGHDRITQQIAIGFPDLTTIFELDGLDRQTRSTDARGILTRTDFDLVGRRKKFVEDETGILERQTDFTYNHLSQLVTQIVKNKTSDDTPLADQLTTYRYDSLGRQIRAVYPDSSDHADPMGCTDCTRSMYDVAGRKTQRTDQRGLTTTFAYSDRGLLLTRTTGADRDTFAYDSVGRMENAQRGTTSDPDAVSVDVMTYTDLGDLDFETQTIAGGTARTVDYNHDQAGNRIHLTYPGGDVLDYTPTVLNQVDDVNLNAAPFLDYEYKGRLLDKRRTITSDPGGNTEYQYDIGYDSHRRVNTIINRFQPGVGDPQTIVSYNFNHDNNGNPLTQIATEGMASFITDDRAFSVDRLNRLTGTEYFENGQIESTTFDLVGNRESHTNRAGTVTAYGAINPANEYSTIGGIAVAYDGAGSLTVDQDGRQYAYDEHNRLIQIKASDNTILANYTYDGLGRRIVFEDPVAAVTTRYYYDGQSVIEERDASDVRVRFHVNGAQFIDERVATFEDSTSEFTYYLLNKNYSIAGTGNADGSSIERLDYSSTGDFAGGGPGATSFYHDSDNDLDLDLRDFASLQNCFGQTDPTCLATHDFDAADVSDGDIDLSDYARFIECFHGPFVTPDQACGQPIMLATLPQSGTFAMHGRPVDILSDGHSLIPIRARYYDASNGRWLQRDPLPYNDGSNLYEPFRGNALRNTDPSGEGILTWLLVGDYNLSDAQFLRDNGLRTVTTPIYGFFEGGIQTIGGVGLEFGRMFIGESAAQQRLVNLVESEFEIGGATADETSLVILRVTGQGVVDFFGASNVATAINGEQIVFMAEGQVFVVDVGAFERVQAGIAGVGQFAAAIGGLGGGGLGRSAVTNPLRARVLNNIAKSQAARAASRFEVFAAREQMLAISRGGAAPVRAGQAGVASVVAELKQAGFVVRGSEITIETAVGRTRLDLFVESPLEGGVIPGTAARMNPLQEFFVEVKTGPTARLSRNQRLTIPIIRSKGGIPRGLNATKADLLVGEHSRSYQVFIIRR